VIRADLIVEGAAEVVTCAAHAPSPATTHASTQSDAGVIPDGVVACADGVIVFVGTAEACRASVALDPSGRRIDARGGVVLPGFVDAHTHLPFGGWRDDELEKRLAGATYQEIAAAGGGILSTVRATRALTPSALEALVRERLDAMLEGGTTTVEAKSGYGLSRESELAILEALARVLDHPVEVLPTFLGAHVVGPEYRAGGAGRRAEYVRLVAETLLPEVASRGLARFCDVFIDQGAFTVPEARTILEAARRLGLGVRVHAEQLSRTGATRLAIALGAYSVDHLERLDAGDVAALAEAWAARGAGAGSSASGAGRDAGASVAAAASAAPIAPTATRAPVAVVLPGASYFLRETVRPPVRALIAAGVRVAVATDFNPGTSPCFAMTPILGLACLLFGMTPDEAIVAATRHGALALGVEDRVGSIEAGKQADLVVWDVPGRRHLAYRIGPIPCAVVIKRGRIVARDGRRASASASGALPRIGGFAMLVDLTTRQLLERLASDAPTPGGGSASALAGAQAAALVEMVASLTLGNEKYAASRGALEPIRTKAASYRAELADLVDRDADAYDGVVAAMRLPKQTEEEKAARKTARAQALRYAAEIPLKTAELSVAVSDLAAAAAPIANPSAGSDLQVAAMLAEAALGGAAANVRINLGGAGSEEFAAKANERLDAWTRRAAENAAAIRAKFA
jgi:imidazolonepropionase